MLLLAEKYFGTNVLAKELTCMTLFRRHTTNFSFHVMKAKKTLTN